MNLTGKSDICRTTKDGAIYLMMTFGKMRGQQSDYNAEGTLGRDFDGQRADDVGDCRHQDVASDPPVTDPGCDRNRDPKLTTGDVYGCGLTFSVGSVNWVDLPLIKFS